MIHIYQNFYTDETPVALFKQSDITLASLQEVKWQQETTPLHRWSLQQQSLINKHICKINIQESNTLSIKTSQCQL